MSALSQWFDQRPLIVLHAGPKPDDVARRRFDAAHELGIWSLHGEPDPGNAVLEQQANIFAAAFLMPAGEIADDLPDRYDLQQLVHLKHTWVHRFSRCCTDRASRTPEPRCLSACHGALSATYGRRREPHPLGDGEAPVLLCRAAGLAFGEDPLPALAVAVALPEARVRDLLDAAPPARPRMEPSAMLTDLNDHRRRRVGCR